MLALSTLFMIARFAIRTIKRRFFLVEEIFATLAWALSVAICANIISIAPLFFKTAAVGAKVLPPYPDYAQDSKHVTTAIFVNGALFWSCLWSVKVALMLQCKRLIERQPVYNIVWWCIIAFVAVSYVGCYIPSLFLCDNVKDLFNYCECSASVFPCPLLCYELTTRKAKCIGPDFSKRMARNVNTYYSLDIATDLMSQLVRSIPSPSPLLTHLKFSFSDSHPLPGPTQPGSQVQHHGHLRGWCHLYLRRVPLFLQA